MKKILLLALLLLALGLPSWAQTFQPKPLDNQGKGIIYDTEYSLDFKFHTNGMSLPISVGFNVGRLKTYYKTDFFFVELGGLAHQKEYRQNVQSFVSINGVSPRAYIYGKQNSFYTLRGGVGRKRYLTEKAKHRGVAAGYSYRFGGTLGILKPYYLQVIVDEGNRNTLQDIRYSEEQEDLFLDRRRIFGAAAFGRGLGELDFRPGLHAQLAIHLDWGAYDDMVKALEVGVMGDFFFNEIPIIVERENVNNSPLFLNLFITLQLGWRR